MTQVVTGTFHDEEKAAQALQALINEGVPLDELSVVVADERGEHDVPIEEKRPVLKSTLAGTALGAALGGVGAVLVATGVLAAPGIGLVAAGPVLAILRGVATGAFFGELVGLHAGLGFWKEEADLHGEDLKKGAALLVVHSDDLHDAARAVFERVGADRITG
jgi:hypothetical protein